MTTCTTCNASGQVDLPMKAGASFAERGTCPDCNGTGNVEQVAAPVPGEFAPSESAEIVGSGSMDSEGNITESESSVVPKAEGATESLEDSSDGEDSSEPTPIAPDVSETQTSDPAALQN